MQTYKQLAKCPSLHDPRWQSCHSATAPKSSDLPIWVIVEDLFAIGQAVISCRYESRLNDGWAASSRWISERVAQTPIPIDRTKNTTIAGPIWVWDSEKDLPLFRQRPDPRWAYRPHGLYVAPDLHPDYTHWLPGDETQKPTCAPAPADEYRQLAQGELVQGGDQVFSDLSRVWIVCSEGCGTQQHAGCIYRRKVGVPHRTPAPSVFSSASMTFSGGSSGQPSLVISSDGTIDCSDPSAGAKAFVAALKSLLESTFGLQAKAQRIQDLELDAIESAKTIASQLARITKLERDAADDARRYRDSLAKAEDSAAYWKAKWNESLEQLSAAEKQASDANWARAVAAAKATDLEKKLGVFTSGNTFLNTCVEADREVIRRHRERLFRFEAQQKKWHALWHAIRELRSVSPTIALPAGVSIWHWVQVADKHDECSTPVGGITLPKEAT